LGAIRAFSSRRRLHLGEPCHGAGEGHEGPEGREGLFAAQGDPAEAFDAVEEALDEMALLVERPVDRLASCAGRVLLDLRPGAEFVGSEAAQRIGGRQAASATAWPTPSSPAIRGWACGGLRAVTPVPRRDLEPDRQAERIDDRVDPGRQATPGAADRTSLKPPFCEVASAWTLQMVASTRTYSKSGSWTKALKRLSQTPPMVHRQAPATHRPPVAQPRGQIARGARLYRPAKAPRRQTAGCPPQSVPGRPPCLQAAARCAPTANPSAFVCSRSPPFATLNQTSDQLGIP